MSPLEQDAVLDVCLSDDLDNERRRAAADSNDNDTIYPEEMTAQQARSLRVDELRAACVEVMRLQNFLRMVGSPPNRQGFRATFAQALYDRECQRAYDVIRMLDRALELEGE